jgi:hypothetical protein
VAIIRHASANWVSIFSQQPMNMIRRRPITRSKSSSVPLEEASLRLADKPSANSQTDRPDYLNECIGLFPPTEILE